MQRDDQDPYDSTSAEPLDPSDPGFDPNVNNPTTWDPGADHPSNTYSGWEWDPNMSRYVQTGAPKTDTPPPPQDGGSKDTSTPPPDTTGGSSAPPPPQVAPPAVPSGGTGVPAASSGTGSTAAELAIQQTLHGASGSAPAPTLPSVAQPDPATTAFGQQIRARLLAALGQGPVTADDPEIAPAVMANKVATERGLENERNAIAERMHAQGLGNSGSLDQQTQAAMERAAMGEGNFVGNALMSAAQDRRNQLTQLLQEGGNILNADDAQALQGKIADLDAFLRQQGITNQNNQANDQMGLTGAYYQALLKQQQIRDLLGA
jgi:hypothetical protein